jgi:hypothetical protein
LKLFSFNVYIVYMNASTRKYDTLLILPSYINDIIKHVYFCVAWILDSKLYV